MNAKIVEVDGIKLKLTNLEKQLWPNITKENLIRYYEEMAPVILPYLKNRPLTMNRFPDGIKAEGFFQKDIGRLKQPWMQTKKIQDLSTEASAKAGKDGTTTEYLVCNNKAILIYLANLACLELHPWLSQIDDLEHPDFLVLDLDPENIAFEKVIEVAKTAKEILNQLNIKAYLKTSGARGLHIFVPLNGKLTFDQSKNYAKVLAQKIYKKTPQITSLDRLPQTRQNKVYIDWMQNAQAQTVVAPFSPRPEEGSPISAPLKWEELENNFKPQDFTIENIQSRIQKIGDTFKPILSDHNDLEKILN